MKLKHKNNVRINNYGFGNRCPRRALQNATSEYYAGFSTADQTCGRFNSFLKFCEGLNTPIKDLRNITQDMANEYANHISLRFTSNQISLNTAHNYIASFNQSMKIVRGDRKIFISAIKHAELPKRSFVATENKASDETLLDLISEPDNIDTAQRILNRGFGLRFEESSKENCAELLKEALKSNQITISRGTKGGRKRIIPITNPIQIKALEKAANIQKENSSLIDNEETYIQFSRKKYRQNKGHKYHASRHANAQQRYLEITGADCPLRSHKKHGKEHINYLATQLGISIDKAKLKDREARLVISK